MGKKKFDPFVNPKKGHEPRKEVKPEELDKRQPQPKRKPKIRGI